MSLTNLSFVEMTSKKCQWREHLYSADAEVTWQVAEGHSKAGLHSAQLAQRTSGRLTLVFLPVHQLQELSNTEAVQPHTVQDFSLYSLYSKTSPLTGFACQDWVPAVYPLENSLNNCTPSKISLQVCFMPTDLQIISFQLAKENLEVTCFVLEKT